MAKPAYEERLRTRARHIDAAQPRLHEEDEHHAEEQPEGVGVGSRQVDRRVVVDAVVALERGDAGRQREDRVVVGGHPHGRRAELCLWWESAPAPLGTITFFRPQIVRPTVPRYGWTCIEFHFAPRQAASSRHAH